MTWYAFNPWFTGEVAAGSPNATPEAPPNFNTADTPGLPRPRWRQWGWAVEPFPEPAPQPVAYAFDSGGWFSGEVPVGTVDSVRARPDVLSAADTEGQPRARWVAGAWLVQAWAAPPRHITRRSFTNRFTSLEEAAIDLASIDNPAGTQPQRIQAAVLRAQRRKVSESPYVDLDLAQTRAGVQALEAAGLLAAGRALQILDAPVDPTERYVP